MISAKSFFFEEEDGLLRRRHPCVPDLEQIVVPEKLCNRFLHLTHHTKIAGHPGRTMIFTRLRRAFHWPLMATDISLNVRTCPDCTLNHLRLIR